MAVERTAGVHLDAQQPVLDGGFAHAGSASQIFTMDLDGRNVEKASYHALAGEQHPLQLKDGRIVFSSWQLFGMLPYRNDNGSPGSFGTLGNFFHIYSQNPDGTNVFAIYGQHTSNHGTYAGAAPAHFAAHFLTQSSDGRLWTADYYRGNNSGFGEIVGFPLPPEGQEGIGPDSLPPARYLPAAGIHRTHDVGQRF